MPELLAAADLVISRAGALTLAELEAVGRAAVLIPSPNVAENHQYFNAMELQKAGAAVVIEEKDLTGEKLVETVADMLAQPGKLAEMGKNARSLSVDDSLDRIAAALLKLVQTRKTGKNGKEVCAMQQIPNGSNGNIYDLRQDLQRPPAPSQQEDTPGSTDSRYGFNGEPLSRPPSRTPAAPCADPHRQQHRVPHPAAPHGAEQRPAHPQSEPQRAARTAQLAAQLQRRPGKECRSGAEQPEKAERQTRAARQR